MELGFIDMLLIWAAMALVWQLGRRSVFTDIQSLLDQQDREGDQQEEALEIQRDEQGWFSYDSQGQFVAWAPALGDMFRAVADRYPDKQWRIDGPALSTLSGRSLPDVVKEIRAYFPQQ
jgi:hypothetical protein